MNEPKVHQNPPLADLNAANMDAEAARREETKQVVVVANSALRAAFDPRTGRRIQKNIVPQPTRARV